ncbi:MAG: rhomboid family intramembrane serine protease [Demequina sp.]|nr:rhomboid family intramembrane serine protease [Demequina sp.]
MNSTPDAGAGYGASAPPVCPRHPDRISYVTCQRCGRPVCPECQRPAPVGIQCVDCVREEAARRGPLLNRLGFVSAQGTPWVTYGLIIANVAAYIIGMYVLGYQRWVIDWALWPGFTDSVFGVGTEPYRWVSSAFLHFGLFHIGMNMLVLWQFGTQLEPALGRLRFGLIYVLSMLGSSAMIVFIGGNGESPHGGASGAIFGLIAAFAVVLIKLKMPAQGLIASAGIWLVAGFFIGGISWQGHLGGAITGALVMFVMLRGVEKRQAKRNERITPV